MKTNIKNFIFMAIVVMMIATSCCKDCPDCPTCPTCPPQKECPTCPEVNPVVAPKAYQQDAFVKANAITITTNGVPTSYSVIGYELIVQGEEDPIDEITLNLKVTLKSGSTVDLTHVDLANASQTGYYDPKATYPRYWVINMSDTKALGLDRNFKAEDIASYSYSGKIRIRDKWFDIPSGTSSPSMRSAAAVRSAAPAESEKPISSVQMRTYVIDGRMLFAL